MIRFAKFRHPELGPRVGDRFHKKRRREAWCKAKRLAQREKFDREWRPPKWVFRVFNLEPKRRPLLSVFKRLRFFLRRAPNVD